MSFIFFDLLIICTFNCSSAWAAKPTTPTGDLSVWVTLEGDFAPSTHKVFVDPLVCGDIVEQQAIIRDAQNDLQNVVVWLESKTHSLGIKRKIHETKEILIKGCRFAPYLLLSYPGDLISISSQDPVNFDIHVNSTVNRRKTMTLPPNLQKVEFRLDKPEIVPISCDLHPWMRAYIVVRNTPFFEITNAEGLAKFTDVPVGKYELYLWHEAFGQKKWKEEIEVKPTNSSVSIDWKDLDTQQ